YYVSNRGELVCLNLKSFLREGADKESNEHGSDAVAWELDMLSSLGVVKRDAGYVWYPLCSPQVIDELVFFITGNGSTFGYGQAFPKVRFVPRADVPSFLAVDKKTGKTVWSSNAPGKNIMYGQWASPVSAQVKNLAQVLFPGGDGRLYGFEAGT